MKKKQSIIVVLLIAIIGVAGITIAYFSSTTTFENVFETPEYGTKYIEKFTSPDNWLPGDEMEKTLQVTNSGNVDEAVRVKVEESWISKRGTTLPLTQGDNVAALINFINNDDWIKVEVDGENYYYYYYNYKLAPGETTSKLLDKVTFNPLINASTTCSDTVVDGVITRTCNSNGTGYDGATYTLTLTVETVQYNKYQEVWNTNVNILPTKEIVVFGLHVNPKSATYETGDKHQMFAFKHAATAQTPAQTDYRYIGNNPYNYVYFNCNSLDNQNTSTCEVWRIIGVFDVEREIDDEENPGQKITITETRMKLVRGSLIKNDSLGNDWTIATLKTFLNENYYNRKGEAASYGLKASTRGIIEEAKYYLGALGYNSINDPFGSTERIYEQERGSKLCSSCGGDNDKLKWQGNVGLMYPSDMYMTYANGVNSTCYNNPHKCYKSAGLATKGWIFNTNILQDQSTIVNTWLLSTYADRVLASFENGYLNHTFSSYSYGVRPVVYLSSDIQIIDGDGSSGNPYKLQKAQ